MCLPWPFRRREGYGLLCWGPLLSGSSPYSVTFSTKSGRTPLLPFHALLLFRLPSELTLRTLFALPAFGVFRPYPNISLTFRRLHRFWGFFVGLFGVRLRLLFGFIPCGGHELNVQGQLRPIVEGPCVDVAALLR